MKVSLIALLCCTANGLVLEEESKGNYAYVTMWLNKVKVPEFVFKRVLSKEETVLLNTAPIKDASGMPILMAGQGIQSSVLETEKPKKEAAELKQKIPLRPRNSQWRGIIDIAQNLRDVGSQIPLVVLTNEDAFKNETLQAENPNVKFVWVNESDFLDRHCKIGKGHELHFQKLSIWKMTQYDKLIWFDTDVAFAKNIDYLFTSKKYDLNDGNRIYGQHDDYQCDGRVWSPTSGGICSAMLLLKPSTFHYEGLMLQQKKMQSCWGDQSIIGSYFMGGKKEAHPFERSTINFARCSKKDGWMDVVHFSGSPNAKRVGDVDKRAADGQVLSPEVVADKKLALAKKMALDAQKAKNKKEREEKRWVEVAKATKSK